jgi:lipopolysaccharide transport protein LptA
MAASFRKLLACAALLAPLAQSQAAPAALARDARAPIFFDSSGGTIDLKTNTAVFYKIRISKGGMSITADQGQASQQRSQNLYFENNVWNFRGNVKITVNNELTKAVANGKPASFEQTVTKTGKLAKGHADTIDYDASKHLVRFLKDAYLTNGDHEMTGQALKYDVVAQKVLAEESEQNSQRVHIIITPPPPKTPPPKTNP